MKSNASCNEFESNEVAKLWNVSREQENKTRKVKKNKTKKKMVEADIEIAILHKQKNCC